MKGNTHKNSKKYTSSKDNENKKLKALLEKAKESIKKYDKKIKEKDKKIKEIEKEKDKSLEEKDKSLKEKDKKIKEIEKEKDKKIKEIEKKDKKIKEIEKEKDKKIKEIEKEKDKKIKEIDKRSSAAKSFSLLKKYEDLEKLYDEANFPSNCSDDLLKNYFSLRAQNTPEFICPPSSIAYTKGEIINISRFRRNMVTGTRSDFCVKLASLNDDDITKLIIETFFKSNRDNIFENLVNKLVVMLNKFRGMMEFITTKFGKVNEPGEFQPAFMIFLEEVCRLFALALNTSTKFVYAANRIELECGIQMKINNKNAEITLNGYTDLIIVKNKAADIKVENAILGELKPPLSNLFQSGSSSCRDQQLGQLLAYGKMINSSSLLKSLLTDGFIISLAFKKNQDFYITNRVVDSKSYILRLLLVISDISSVKLLKKIQKNCKIIASEEDPINDTVVEIKPMNITQSLSNPKINKSRGKNDHNKETYDDEKSIVYIYDESTDIYIEESFKKLFEFQANKENFKYLSRENLMNHTQSFPKWGQSKCIF
jgi:hypothetical protein